MAPMSGRTACFAVAALVCAALGFASIASAATLIEPSAGSTVAPRSDGTTRFAWTLGPGEGDAYVLVGSAPSADPSHEDEAACGGSENLLSTTCSDLQPLAAGTHYAWVETNGEAGPGISTASSFLVPPLLKLGSAIPGERSREAPISTSHEPYLGRNPLCVAGVYANVPDTPISLAFTITSGDRVIQRAHRTLRMPAELSDGGTATTIEIPRHRGVRAGSQISCNVVARALALTRSGSSRLKAP